MKIVLIDDSTTNLVILRNLCGRIVGAECISYTDAEPALEYLFSNDVGLIILDYSMPRITGVEMTKRLRASPRHGTTPIVMVTGSTEVAVHKRAVEVGVTDLFLKPIRVADYLARLERLIASSKGGAAMPAYAQHAFVAGP